MIWSLCMQLFDINAQCSLESWIGCLALFIYVHVPHSEPEITSS